MPTIEAKLTRFLIAEDGTQMEMAITVSGEHAKIAETVTKFAETEPSKLELPDFLGPWRDMTPEEISEYQTNKDDDECAVAEDDYE